MPGNPKKKPDSKKGQPGQKAPPPEKKESRKGEDLKADLKAMLKSRNVI